MSVGASEEAARTAWLLLEPAQLAVVCFAGTAACSSSESLSWKKGELPHASTHAFHVPHCPGRSLARGSALLAPRREDKASPISQFIPQRLNLGVAMVATMAMTREYTDRERLSVR